MLFQNGPAPTITLDTPLHNVRKPSALEMVTMAFDMPVYMAVGEGLTICMRVCSSVSAWVPQHQTTWLGAAYLEQIDGIHHRVFLRPISPCPRMFGGRGSLRQCPRTRLQACSPRGKNWAEELHSWRIVSEKSSLSMGVDGGAILVFDLFHSGPLMGGH